MEQLAAFVNERKSRDATPVCAFLYDLSALAVHARAVRSTLPAEAELFYAVKANVEPQILATLAPLVDGFEVASRGEIEAVRQAAGGVRIIMGGPARTEADILAALYHGVERLHVESLHQLRLAGHVSQRQGAVLPILLRVNPSGGGLSEATLRMGGAPTQFGLDPEQVPEAIRLARTLPALRLDGFHIHALSNVLDAEAHLENIAAYLQLVNGWARAFDIVPRVLNVGGGLGVNYADTWAQFPLQRFARGLDRLLRSEGPGYPLQFESGRYFAAFCGHYLAEVVDIKCNHGEVFALLRGGTHHFRLPASWAHSHPFHVLPVQDWPYPFSRPGITNSPVTLAGELCTPKDILARQVPVKQLRVGDVVAFELAGAYGWHISHHDFLSHPHPELVFLDGKALHGQGAATGTGCGYPTPSRESLCRTELHLSKSP